MHKDKKYETLLTICLGFAVLYWFTGHRWMLALSILIGVSGLFIPAVAKGISWFWWQLAKWLGYVNSKVLLTLVYFLILTPIALISRVFFKKDYLQLKSTGKGSSFRERNHTYTRTDFEKTW